MPTMSLRYPFPQTPEDFESLCLRLFRKHWECEDFKKYARRGNKQTGIDLIGTDKQGRTCAIQCKQRDFHRDLTETEVLTEITLAKASKTKISRYAIATTAKRDTGLQELAIEKTKEHKREGGFSVEVYSWDDIVELLNQYPEVPREIYGPGVELPSPLHQLPPPPRDFTGREDELAELRNAIKGGKVAISGLRGMGGVGKTVLALKLAEELAPSYGDAQICLDLKGTSDALTPAKIMEHVIRSFHPDAKLPDDQSQIAGLYRDVLSGKGTLLLMDNTLNAAQVAPLVPPPGNMMIVTSRQKFAVAGWFALDLDVLPADESKQLLLTLCPRIEGYADELAGLCACLPLALRLAGGALAAREDMTVVDYVRDLKATGARLKTLDKFKHLTDVEQKIEGSFDLSCRLLSGDLQRLWRMLSVFPFDFDPAAAGAVWEVALDVAKECLGDLRTYSLIDWNEDTNRYRLHDLARDFAASRLGDCPLFPVGARPSALRSPDVSGEGALPKEKEGLSPGSKPVGARRAVPKADQKPGGKESLSPAPTEEYSARKRHAAHYLDVLRSADDLYLKGGENVVTGLALFDLERANIEAGFQWAVKHLDSDSDAARMANDYPDAGPYCLDLRQHPRNERIPWLEAALRAARTLKDKKAEGNHLGNLGLAYFDLGDARKAIEYYEKRIAIAVEIGDRHGEGYALGNLGTAYSALGDARKAIEYHEKALAIMQELGDRRAEGSILGNLGNAYSALGDARKTIDYYEKALVVCREIGDRRGEGADLGNLGNVYAALGDARKAIEYYEKQLVIVREIGDIRGECTDLWNLADELYKLGRRDEAIRHAEASLKIMDAIESPFAPKVRAALAKWKAE